MVRHIVLLGVLFVALVVMSMGTAMADRLGGAYRGPYEDEIRPKEATSTAVTGDGTAPTGGGTTDTGGSGKSGDGDMSAGGDADGDSDGDDGGEADPPPNGDSGAGMDSGGNSGSGSNAPPPNAGGSGGGDISGGGLTPGGGGKKAVIDTKAYWPFYFEYNKEAILARLLAERGGGGQIAPTCSSWFYTSASEVRRINRVSEDQKLQVIFPVLQQALEAKSPWVRDAACLALGKLGTAEAVPLLIERAERETDLEVRQDALLALGLTRRPEALDTLLRTLTQSDPRLRPYAALGLALLGRKEEAIGDLLKEYRAAWMSRDGEHTAAVYAVALGHLIGEEQVDQLAAPLREKGRQLLKVYVCQALGNVGGENARRWLIRSSTKEREEVQAAVALALSNFPDKDTMVILSGKDFAGASSRMTKAYSQVALGLTGRNVPARDKLRLMVSKKLQDAAENPLKDRYAAMFAAIGLGIMGDSAANGFFYEEFEDEKQSRYAPENYSAMAVSLALMGDRGSSRFLRGIVRRAKDPNFQGYAALALGILGDTDGKKLLTDILKDSRAAADVQRPACWGLGLLGDAKDIPVLIDVLKLDRDDKHTVRGAAAMALGLIGDQAALKPLISMATGDPNTSNRAFAIVALGCLADPELMPRLPQLFSNTHYREEVKVCRDALRNL